MEVPEQESCTSGCHSKGFTGFCIILWTCGFLQLVCLSQSVTNITLATEHRFINNLENMLLCFPVLESWQHLKIAANSLAMSSRSNNIISGWLLYIQNSCSYQAHISQSQKTWRVSMACNVHHFANTSAGNTGSEEPCRVSPQYWRSIQVYTILRYKCKLSMVFHVLISSFQSLPLISEKLYCWTADDKNPGSTFYEIVTLPTLAPHLAQPEYLPGHMGNLVPIPQPCSQQIWDGIVAVESGTLRPSTFVLKLPLIYKNWFCLSAQAMFLCLAGTGPIT